jgi:hypothetical protein
MDFAKHRLMCLIAEKHWQGVEWVKIQRDHRLIRDIDMEIQADDVLALRLTWFDLARRRRKRTGLYQLTRLGWDFLAGKAQVPEIIRCKDGEVRYRSECMVSVRDIKDVILDKAYWDAYAQGE